MFDMICYVWFTGCKQGGGLTAVKGTPLNNRLTLLNNLLTPHHCDQRHLFPCVGLDAHASVTFNFGDTCFAFDLAKYEALRHMELSHEGEWYTKSYILRHEVIQRVITELYFIL